ncbi:MAG: recombination mediator RecR [Patescibacteria group bacterium]|jgi:recombination protein RecR|nr:recombination mediator RecR [Patescibacteria group bacterium]
MSKLPKALDEVVEAFCLLPGVGTRTAERYANYLLKRDPKIAQSLADSLDNLHSKISFCKKTFAIISSGQEYSELYIDPRRDKTIVAVVSEPFDIYAIEKTNQFQGTYHVLGGLISPLDNISSEQLHFKELQKRIDEDKIKELILAFNASVEGEITSIYIKNLLKDKDIKLTRLAQGLPTGIDIEYADMITLTKALEGRYLIK